MTVENSLSGLLARLMTFAGNSIESFGKVNEAITTDSESVVVNIENPDGTTDTFTIPSFGYLKNSIERLNNNINAIANVDGGGSSVRLSDGTYRRLVTMRLPSEAPTVKRINSVNTFSVKSNYFFENLINPLLYVSVDLTGQISAGTDRVMVKRFLLDTDTTSKRNTFDVMFKNNSNIDYNAFLQTLVDNGISYVLDEETVTLRPKTRRYTGTFSVIRITNDTVTETVNGASVTRTRKLVKLDGITYTDVKSGYADTVQLGVGDCLEVVSDPVDTKYRIASIDTSTSTVVLELVEGFRSVKIGADYFRISSEKTDDTAVDVTVGFDEHCVVFVKPVDSDSNMAASAWSPGTGFWSNDLTLMDADGKTVTLQQFYQKAVVDFGSYLIGYARDWYPTSSEGVVPNPPELDASNFKVVQINKQVADSDDITRIKKLNSEKDNLSAQINAKNTAIAELKNRIQTTNYASDMFRDADILELRNKTAEYESLVSAYNSKVKNISSLANSSSAASVSPKYRVRGFWAMPAEQSTDATGPQAVIRFRIRYRYLTPDGSGNSTEQIGRTLSGSFSNYNIVDGELRGRHKNKDGDFVWDAVDINDSSEVNINQLDIPITKGEMVEIQVKSVSEAGWPYNPLESAWSEPVTVAFPEELSGNSVLDDILKANTADESLLLIQQTLNSRGVTAHLADSFSTKDAVFTHTGKTIASGFVSDEQNPISMYDKIAEMSRAIEQMYEIIGNSTGVMVVNLSDENGNVYELTQDSLTRVFAGSYVTEADKLTVKKGAIITKNFSINIQNTAQTGLRLISKFYGSRTSMVKESESYTGHEDYPNAGTYDAQNSDYNSFYRYDLVPINVYAPDCIDGVVVSDNHYQSAQCRNQFVNVRFMSVGGDVDFYRPSGGAFDSYESTVGPGDYQSESFVWDSAGGFNQAGNPVTQGSCLRNFMVHVDHPYVRNRQAFFAELRKLFGINDATGENGMGLYISDEISAYESSMAKYLFRLPKNEQYTITNMSSGDTVMNIAQSGQGSLRKASMKNVINRQTPYQYARMTEATWPAPAGTSSAGGTILTTSAEAGTVDIGITHKIGYEPNDQYLIGPDTCTSYLYLNPQNHNYIQVEGDSRNSSRVVSGGSVLSIPLTFQFRMTDYYGEGSDGTGYIMGDPTISTVSKKNLNNIYLANRVGIDIWNSKDEPVSFDIEIYATYGETSGNINPNSLVQYTASTMSSAINKSPRKSGSVVGESVDGLNIGAVNAGKKKR